MLSQTILFLKAEYVNTSNELPYLLVSLDSSSEFTNREQRNEADGSTWAGVRRSWSKAENRVSFKKRKRQGFYQHQAVDEKPENPYFYASNPFSNPSRNPQFYAI